MQMGAENPSSEIRTPSLRKKGDVPLLMLFCDIPTSLSRKKTRRMEEESDLK